LHDGRGIAETQTIQRGVLAKMDVELDILGGSESVFKSAVLFWLDIYGSSDEVAFHKMGFETNDL